jgi:hypothetical protein
MMITGCNLRTPYQQVAMLDTETGELLGQRLEYEHGETRAFYAALQGRVRVGIEEWLRVPYKSGLGSGGLYF